MQLANKEVSSNLQSTNIEWIGTPRTWRRPRTQCGENNPARTDTTWKRFATQPDSTSTRGNEEINTCLHWHCSGGRKQKASRFPCGRTTTRMKSGLCKKF